MPNRFHELGWVLFRDPEADALAVWNQTPMVPMANVEGFDALGKIALGTLVIHAPCFPIKLTSSRILDGLGAR
jgi:hypothetical protein